MTAQYSVVYPKRNLKGVPIDVWADTVVNSDRITLTRDNSHITKITHYKDQGGVEHEHLRARCIVHDSSTTHTSWIRIDRTRGPRADNATSTANSPSAIPASPADIPPTAAIDPSGITKNSHAQATMSQSRTSSLAAASGYSLELSLGSFPKHSAHDLISVAQVNVVTELSNDKEDVFIVDKITTSDELTLPVAHFAVLVHLISKSKELYHPQNQNCYEFSAAIVECVLRGCPNHRSFAHQQVTNHRLQGRFCTMDVSTPSKISSPKTINKLYTAWSNRHDTIDGMLSSAEVSLHCFLCFSFVATNTTARETREIIN